MESINLLLVVDGDEEDLGFTKWHIHSADLPVGEVLVAHTLAEGERVLRSQSVDVVLLELALPDSTGLDTLKAMRPLSDGLVIVLTGVENEQTGIDAIRLGADDYLVKGRLTDDSLRSSIAFAMARRDVRHTTRRVNAKLDALADLARKA